MKTATITWIAYKNYGTYLQAYALQQIIKKLGHENHIIYDSHFARYAPNEITVKQRIIEFLKMVLKGKNHLTHFLYKSFARRYLKIDYNVKSIEGLGNKYDAFVCGSDQIWSPYLEFEPYYYLGFPAKKKIAYAPSVGTSNVSEEYIKNVTPYLSQFNSLSTREFVGSEILARYLERPVKTVLDPTLLLSAEDWRRILKNLKDKDYLLCYFLTPNQWYVDAAKAYAEKYQLKLYIFATDSMYEAIADKMIYGGPREFLSYINNAKMVFTDSFHATIFSILFHKEFLTFKRFEDGKGKDQNARIYNLFESLGISSIFIGIKDVEEIHKQRINDWKVIEDKLSKLRKDSIHYLKTALSDEHNM